MSAFSFLCIYTDLTDIAMKLFTQTPGGDGDASHRWFQKIAMSLPNKASFHSDLRIAA